MKLNKILLSASLLFVGVCATAQETVTEYVFKPHWYGQLQIGGQETLGEGKFGKLLGPNAQIAFGYQFNPYIGLRLAVDGWQSRGAINLDAEKWAPTYFKWAYVAPKLDAMIDMTNLIGGYNPTRLVQVDFIAGLGVNVAWHNNDANNINAAHPLTGFDGQPTVPLQFAWDGTKCRFLGQLGFDVNFNVSNRVQIGLEFTANTTNDTYNSKKGANTDWYFNGLVGVKYAFGPKYETVTRVIEPPVLPEPQIIEKIVERVVEVPVEVAPVAPKEFRRDVFFKINTYNITPTEMTKVAEVANYLNQNPNSTVTVTGYADKGTGTLAINLRLSAQRAEAVAKALQKDYNISPSRITVKSMGESEYQPYDTPVQNRVAICIAE